MLWFNLHNHPMRQIELEILFIGVEIGTWKSCITCSKLPDHSVTEPGLELARVLVAVYLFHDPVVHQID